LNWPLLTNSLLVSALATLLAVSFGIAAALWLGGLGRRCRHWFTTVAIIALAMPPFLATNCWLDLLGNGGVWRSWLPLNIFSLGGAVWILALLLWPLAALMVLAAFRRLQPAQLESDAAVSGCALIRGLLLPAGRTALAQASLLTFVLALNNFAVPAILQLKIFPAEIWVRFNTSFDTLGVLRASWPLLIVPLLVVLWLSRRELSWPRQQCSVPPKLFRRQLGPKWFWGCGLLSILVSLLAVGLPLIDLATVKRTWTELPGAIEAGQAAVWNSFWYAAASATSIVAVAILFELLALTPRFRRSRPAGMSVQFFGWLAWLPFFIPGVLLGIGLITALNHPWSAWFYQSAGVVLLAFTIRYLALGWNAVLNSFAAVDHELSDAARLEGANRWQMLRYVHWPQVAPQIAAAWYVVFLLCLWDVEAMILVYPPGGENLALRIFNLLHYGHNAQVNALCLTLLCLAASPLVLWRLWHLTRGISRNALASLLALLCLASLTGCTPSSSSNEISLQSQIFDRVRIVGTRGVGVGELNKPRSVAVDKADNMYVVDMTGRVQKFSPDGAFLLSWQMPQTDLGKPKGMGRDREGRVIVVEPHYQRLNYFSPDGKLLGQFGHKGTNEGQLIMPRAVGVNSRGETFVSEYGEVERVQEFALSWNTGQSGSNSVATGTLSNGVVPHFIKSFGKAGTGPGEFNRPEGLCVDAHDRLYVADSCNHRIQIFSGDGQFIRSYGRPGKGLGELSYPYDICVDDAGRQYVCEFGNSRIQVFDANDKPLEIIGGPGAEPGSFNNPWGVALDSAGNLYVADSQNHRVQKLMRRHTIAAASPCNSVNLVTHVTM
jgi:ABC-type Fe3+ transport system permease subunit/DNA-binding beta-propeller fold protein YncE